MKSYLPKSTEDGAALIITLLIVVLLATITVSFLSTARIEQTATRNYASKAQAEQLATMATQQAMAKIQQGFSVTGNATTITTTQPGAIWQYTFSNGNCTAVASKNPVGLFSGTGNVTTNGTAYLNNLQNPSSNVTLTSNSSNNQWTITGNASEQINVPLENITSNGTVIGRIAYYVDDEGAKLNLNAATGDRATLNVGSSRSLSFSALASANQSANFTRVVEGNATTNSSATSDIKNWAHFFRPEQISGAVSGFTSGDIPKLSTAPVAGSDYHLKRTPWGTPRLFINDLPTDAANATASVNAIYNALSDTRLRDIYGATFADKYTDLGLKQIAANMLQMRNSNTNTVNASFTSTTQRIGAHTANSLVSIANCCPTANATKFPAEYFGQAPYAYINKIGATVAWGAQDNDGKSASVYLQILPFVTIFNPETSAIPASEVEKWKIEARIDSFTVDITYNDGNGTVGPYTYGPTGFKNSDPYGHDYDEIKKYKNQRSASYSGISKIKEQDRYIIDSEYYFLASDGSLKYDQGSGRTPLNLPLNPGEELQVSLYVWGKVAYWAMQPFTLVVPSPSTIIDFRNVKIKFEYVKLSSISGNTTILRDFVLGSDTGEIDCWILKQGGHPNYLPLGYPTTTNWGTGHPVWWYVPPDKSIKRIDGRVRLSANMTTGNMSQRDYMRSWSLSGNQTWPFPAPNNYEAGPTGAPRVFTKNNTASDPQAYPSVTKNNTIPGDPVTPQTTPFYDFNIPFATTLQFMSGNNSIFTSPQELGKVHTNVQHRKLRFTTQHPNEVATGSGGTGNQTFIPDWAMLDVISFGSNATSVPLPAPVNLNGRFHVPSGSPQPAARTIGVEAALKALDSATLVGNSFNASITASTNRTQYIGGSGIVSSTIAANIGNLTWSTGNFTSGTSTWGKGNATNDAPGGTNSRRKTANFPANQFVLPAEVTEIRSVSDVVPLDSYTSNSTNIKANEGRLSALFPGAATQSRFFMIYAYAQALDKNGMLDSEEVTKTLVEVVENRSTVPSKYTVKELYSQPIQSQ